MNINRFIPLLFKPIFFTMSFARNEPFIWIHLAGIIVLPISLECLWLGLSLGKPESFSYGELAGVALIGIVPVLWMQLIRPFNIFSILLVSLYPQTLSDKQRQILALFKTKTQKWLSGIVATAMMIVLWSIYHFVPVASFNFSWLPQGRWLGLTIASLAFLSSNLFLQVPLAVLRILAIAPDRLATTKPYPVDEIERDFTSFGWRVNRILFLNSNLS